VTAQKRGVSIYSSKRGEYVPIFVNMDVDVDVEHMPATARPAWPLLLRTQICTPVDPATVSADVYKKVVVLIVFCVYIVLLHDMEKIDFQILAMRAVVEARPLFGTRVLNVRLLRFPRWNKKKYRLSFKGHFQIVQRKTNILFYFYQYLFDALGRLIWANRLWIITYTCFICTPFQYFFMLTFLWVCSFLSPTVRLAGVC